MVTKNRNLRLSFGLSLPVLGGLIVIIVTVYQVFHILALFGQSILEKVVLSSPVKFCISLYLLLGLSSLILGLLGSYILLRGLAKQALKPSFLVLV